MGTVLKKAVTAKEAVYFLKIDHLVCLTKTLLICGSRVAVINFFYVTFWRILQLVEKSVYNSYRKIQQDATVYQNLLFHIYMKLNMFWVTHPPSSGA
jgi:hypothetical protein